MELNTIRKVTLIAAADLERELIELIKSEGASGYTVFPTRGQGENEISLVRGGEQANILIEVLTEEAVASSLLQKLAERYLPWEKLIVYEQDVRVLRPKKFERIAYKVYHGNWDPT